MSAASPPKPMVVPTQAAPQSTEPQKKAGDLLQKLIALEGDILNASDKRNLKHIAVNKPRILLPVGHAFLCTWRGHHVRIEAISNQAVVNNQAPFLQWVRHTIKSMAKKNTKDARDFTTSFDFSLQTRRDSDDFSYPFANAYWAPFAPDPHIGGLLFTRDAAWLDAEKPILERLGKITGLGWTALGKAKKAPHPLKRKIIVTGGLLLALAGLLFPVPVSTLAPAEIIAKDPFIVSAPIDGVIDKLHVKPGHLVEAGTVLATLNDTVFRNEYVVAGEEKSVAIARYRQASLTSFVDEKSKRDLAITLAERDLATARESFASERLAKTKLVAMRSGLVIYSDEKDWVGRPVAIGEKIMQIADPTRVLLRIYSPIADSGTLRSGARVRMFLDADPLTPLDAKLIRSNYYAQPQPGGALAYEAYAELEISPEDTPRIGGRGVAKIYGEKAPFGYWLLRKPISAVRQMFGL